MLKFLGPLHSGFAAQELTKLSRQSGPLFFDIIWAAREAERMETLPRVDVSLGAWPFKRFETAEIIPIRKGK